MHSRSSTRPAKPLRAIRLRSASIVAVAALLVGCGSGSHGLSSGQRAGLIAQLEAAKVQAAAKNVTATETTLRQFRASVARLQRSGALDDASARALRLGAQRVLARVTADAAPPPAPAPTPTVTQPAPAAPKPGKGPKDHGKKHGKGHDKGHGGGGEGD